MFGSVSVSLVVILLMGVARGQNNDELYELNIIHFNDFHAHFDEIAVNGASCNPTLGDCIGGYERLYTAIRQAREVEPDSLVLNGGDTFQGTLWYNIFRWNVSQHFMNLLPHDAHVLGNHEFDHGIEGLLPYLERLNAPMLGANVNTTFEPEVGKYIKNHVVIEKKGRKIGIIGILLRTFSAPIGKIIMEDELEAVNREAAILSEQGVDIIIVLSHVGYTTDLSLAATISPEVDIIVGAHSHTFLHNGETPDGSTPAGEYPTVVHQDNGHRILVVQASAYTRYLGNIKIYVNSEGKIEFWSGHPIYLGTSIVQDAHIEGLLEPWRRQVRAVGDEVLGVAVTSLQRGCYNKECALGSWACDGMLEEAMPRASSDAWGYAHVCLINAGGIRNHINAGNVTTEALLKVMPFENTVQVYDLKGEHLLQALEFSVGPGQTNPQSFYSRRMLQVAGLRVVYNATAAAGARVVSARVRCLHCAVPRYEPLRTHDVYRVLSQNYIGDGGSGYTMLSENRENLVTLDVDHVMLQNYLRRQGSVIKDLEGRIQIVY